MKYQVLLVEGSQAIPQMYRNKLIMEQFDLPAVAFSCCRYRPGRSLTSLPWQRT